MFSGIVFGLSAAFLMALSYVFSKRFILTYGSPFQLTVYSQLIQGIFGIIVLSFLAGKYEYPLYSADNGIDWVNLGFVVIAGATSMTGNFCFFRLLKELEASRSSSLLGLKMIVLGLISSIFIGEDLNLQQWLAIVLASVAAVGMNFTGGRIPLKAAVWLMLTLLGYSSSDLSVAELVFRIEGEGCCPAFVANGICCLFSGIAMLPLLFLKQMPKKICMFTDAAPYALGWFTGVMCLLCSFDLVGVIFGTILQSARGVISVIFGVLLVRMGVPGYEPIVRRADWIRRFVMSVLMVLALALYAFSRQTA